MKDRKVTEGVLSMTSPDLTPCHHGWNVRPCCRSPDVGLHWHQVATLLEGLLVEDVAHATRPLQRMRVPLAQRPEVKVRLTHARAPAPSPPGGAKLLASQVDFAVPPCQVVGLQSVVVAAQSTQPTFELGGHRHLQEAVAVPHHLEPRLRTQPHRLPLPADVTDAGTDVGQGHSPVIDLDPQVLQEADAQSAHHDGQHLRPREARGEANAVADFDGEGVVDEVVDQQVLAASLKVVHPPVEGLVVRVAEHCTHGVAWQQQVAVREWREQVSTSSIWQTTWGVTE